MTGRDDSDRGQDDLSDHPVERLLPDLIASPRPVSDEERSSIIRRIASAEFNRNGVTTEEQIRGLTYLGRTVQAWEDSRFVHLVRRVLVQRQWADGTTEEMYVSDLRDVVLDADAHVRLGITGGLPTVEITSPTAFAEPRRGARAQPWTVVIYAPNRGRLISGYQVRRPRPFPGSWSL